MLLMLSVFLNALLAVLLYALDKHMSAKKLPYRSKQLLIGCLFGGLAAFSSEFGIPFQDIIINVRDASPLCAGLIFGAPAGILSGVIGGVYRFFLGAGDYTRIACSLSTVLAGCIAALLRKYMFDNKKPTWGYGAGIACVCEDIHMMMVFLLHLDDASTAFAFVKEATIPMVLGNTVAVGLALLSVSLLSHEKLRRDKKNEQISQTFQRWLFVCILIAYLITSIFTYKLQTNMSQTQTQMVVTLTIDDVYHDITDATDKHLLNIAHEVKEDYLSQDSDTVTLEELAEKHDVTEINLIDQNGVITASTDPNFIGYDMASGEQSAEFLCLYDTETEYVQKYQPIASDPNISRKYAAVTLPDGGIIQVGYSYEQFKGDIDTYIYEVTKNRHIGNSGFVTICNENLEIIAEEREHSSQKLDTLGFSIDPAAMTERTLYETDMLGTACYYSYIYAEGYYIIGTIPQSEANYIRDASIYISILVEIIIFACLFVLVYFLIKKVVINNIRKINGTLAEITHGNLNVKVDVRSNAEFASLSDDINSTVSVLKGYIAEAAARIDKELEYAKTIQLSALPSNFPANESYEIYAQMIAAKEVGGDFYDFYMLDDHTVAFLAADVSGKGIPAAMFMMTAKTTIKALAESGIPVNDVFTKANEKLCANNDSGMFVTAWMGVLDLRTGKLQYVNAGHNPPLLMQDGTFRYLKSRAGFVLAGMEGMRYRLNELTLVPGDRIFLYTDGVTEATDMNQQLYSESRLIAYMNAYGSNNAVELLHGLKEDIDRFVGDAPQFDDITMLMLDYKKGSVDMAERVFPAEENALSDVQNFLEAELDKVGCPTKMQIAISIALEEVFVNVARYAYPDKTGTVHLGFSFEPQERIAILQLTDRGIPFNPLNMPDPDITLSAEDRQIGGLGIFIAKKNMDSLSYRYENGENILTMNKKI